MNNQPKKKEEPNNIIWSASPTPLDENLRVDTESVRKMVKHYIVNEVDGIFLAGNCGEGAYLHQDDLNTLTQVVASEAKGEIKVAVQVSDNSYIRVLENIDSARRNGADIAIIAEPLYFRNVSIETYYNFFQNVLTRSNLPICIYHLGEKASIPIGHEVFRMLCENTAVEMIKDSSSDPSFQKIALKAKEEHNNSLILLNGDEFSCKKYIEAGYNGVMFGGCIYNVGYVRKIIEAVNAGDNELANTLDEKLRELNWTIYGNDIQYSLSGLKFFLTQLQIFKTWNNFPGFPLPSNQRQKIENLLIEDDLFLNNWKE